MPIVLGLAAALSYGAADFLGGTAAKRVGPAAVVLFSQAIGLTVFLLFLPLFIDDGLTSGSAAWAGLSGLVGAVGVGLLYRGLAAGRMSVVAPVSAVVGATVPVVVALTTGESPTSMQLVGVLVALVAVALVSATPERDPGAGRRRGLPEAFGAGLAFGIFFLTFNEAGDQGGVWPLVVARLASVALFGAIALLGRRRVRFERGVRLPIAATGVLDLAANLCFLLGSQRGLLSIVAVLTSLYPGTTVLLARVVLRERMTPLQSGGLVAALVGIALITAG
ncbi:MAG TPA: EamA family transporter [Actinomycetota bacterium]